MKEKILINNSFSPKMLSVLIVMSFTQYAFSTEKAIQYSTTVKADYPTTVLWGDTHLHTNLSLDAFNYGLTLGPEEAYRFAKGETITATHGQKAKLKRPLDFLVVADHAEGLGSMQMLAKDDPILLKSPRLQKWREYQKQGDNKSRRAIAKDSRENGKPPELELDQIRRPAWQQIIKSAEHNNDPGKFTALNGFEWSSIPGGSNLHRVVVFRDGADKVSNLMPFSFLDSGDPEDLWTYMDNYEKEYHGKVLAIPHNGNLSNGLMFKPTKFYGEPMTKKYGQDRSRWEPVYEVTQMKGDGEAHPLLSVNDEFADFETWDKASLGGVPKKDAMIQYEYAREALKNGLLLESQIGANPFKFGMIGSTDSHTALSTVEEDNFYGKHSAGLEPTKKRMTNVIGKSKNIVVLGWEQVASGYAAVWAKENTREAIFDALKRKEVYATTGSRISLRFFAGWNFETKDSVAPNLAEIGYKKGVPMGGDLAAAADGKTPKFLIAASKDPIGANLDRIQVIKGWLDNKGKTHEQVFDVDWSNKSTRKKQKNGKLSVVGNTVNVQQATFDNSIGSVQLATVWQDPSFDASQKAFYYVRVLEIPTPRWTTYDAARFGSEIPKEAPITLQERAYSSPIWYTPK